MIQISDLFKNQIMGDTHRLSLWAHWTEDEDSIKDLTDHDIVEESLALKESVARNTFKLGITDVSSVSFDIIQDTHYPYTSSDFVGKEFALYLVCKNYNGDNPVMADAGTGDTVCVDFPSIECTVDGEYEYYIVCTYGSATVTSDAMYATYSAGDRTRPWRFILPKVNDYGNVLNTVVLHIISSAGSSTYTVRTDGMVDAVAVPLGVFVVDECELNTNKHTRTLKAFDRLYSSSLDKEITYTAGTTVYLSDLIQEMSDITGLDFNLNYHDYALDFSILSEYDDTETYTFNGMPVDGSCSVTLRKIKVTIDDYESEYAHVYEWLPYTVRNNARNLLLLIGQAFGFNFVENTATTGDNVSLVSKYADWINAYKSSTFYALLQQWVSKFRAEPQTSTSGYFDMWHIESATFDGMAYNQDVDGGERSVLPITVNEDDYITDGNTIPVYSTSSAHVIDTTYEAVLYLPPKTGYTAEAFDSIKSAGRWLDVLGITTTLSGRIYTKRIDGGSGSAYGITRYVKLSDLRVAIRKNMYLNLYHYGLLKTYDGDPDEAEWWSEQDYQTYLQFENYIQSYFTYSNLAGSFAVRYRQWCRSQYGTSVEPFVQIGTDWAMWINSVSHTGETWAYQALTDLEVLSGFYIPHLNSFTHKTQIIVLSDDVDPESGYTYWSTHMELYRAWERHYADPYANLQFTASTNVTFKIRDLISAYAEISGYIFRVNRYGDPEFISILELLYPETTLYPEEALYPEDDSTTVVYLWGEGETSLTKLRKLVQYRQDEPLHWKGMRIETRDGWTDAEIIDSGSDGEIYDISNAITKYFTLSTEIIEQIYTLVWGAIGSLDIHSTDVEMVGLPWAECGDIVHIKLGADSDLALVVFNRQMKGIQGLMDKLSQRLK